MLVGLFLKHSKGFQYETCHDFSSSRRSFNSQYEKGRGSSAWTLWIGESSWIYTLIHMDISYIANTTIFRELHVTMKHLAKSYWFHVTLPSSISNFPQVSRLVTCRKEGKVTVTVDPLHRCRPFVTSPTRSFRSCLAWSDEVWFLTVEAAIRKRYMKSYCVSMNDVWIDYT